MPNITRGGSTLRLLRYLAGMGRREEHQRPHLVAGQPGAVLVEHGDLVLSARDLGPIAALLDEPMNDTGTEVDDDTWRRIAERYVALLGFDPLDGTPACRWGRRSSRALSRRQRPRPRGRQPGARGR
jgi:hypothetical protein